MSTTTLLVRRNQLASTRLEQADDRPLADGQIRLGIELFALTSNNITYAAFGEAMAYWQFYPTAESGWGIVPVWGFATVARSRHPGVAVGERVYGYFPMASSVVLAPERVSPSGFFDGAAHRAQLHAVYNQYLRCAQDPLYRRETEPLQALLRPLFTTSWLIDDFLHDNGFFGAGTMLLSSASSKTAWGTAIQLSRRQGIEVVGLTSAANQAYCERLGCYHRVLGYEQLDRIGADQPCVYVDFAGNAGLRRAVHSRFTRLAYSCSIGGTHVDQLGGARDLPGPRPQLFFAPAQVKKRHADWGAAQFGQRMGQAWHEFVAQVGDPARPWLKLSWHRGPDAVAAAWAQVLGGRSDPAAGHVLSFASP